MSSENEMPAQTAGVMMQASQILNLTEVDESSDRNDVSENEDEEAPTAVETLSNTDLATEPALGSVIMQTSQILKLTDQEVESDDDDDLSHSEQGRGADPAAETLELLMDSPSPDVVLKRHSIESVASGDSEMHKLEPYIAIGSTTKKPKDDYLSLQPGSQAKQNADLESKGKATSTPMKSKDAAIPIEITQAASLQSKAPEPLQEESENHIQEEFESDTKRSPKPSHDNEKGIARFTSVGSTPGATRVVPSGSTNDTGESAEFSVQDGCADTGETESAGFVTIDSLQVEATKVDDTDLEEQIRQKIVGEAVEATKLDDGFWTRAKLAYLLIFIVIVIGAVVGGVVAGTRDQPSRSDPPSATSVTTVPTTSSPTAKPSPRPTATPTAAPTLSPSSKELLDVLKKQSPDGGEALDDPLSPQYSSFLWLISGDPDPRRLIQRYAMVTFYYATGGEDWLSQDGWLTDGDECLWTGATCDLSNQLTHLQRPSNNLKGTIPREVDFLTELTTIELQENSISGSLPSEMLNLFSLSVLDLSQNSINGTIPVSTKFVDLTQLHLSSNNFNDTLSPEISSLVSLVSLDLSANEDITGSIPEELSQLTRLQDLILSGLSLSGVLPSTIFSSLTDLRLLDLERSGIEGTLPSSVGGLGRLESLKIGSNQFTGQLPSELRGLTSLSEFYFSSNGFNGTFPEFITELSALEVFEGKDNQLTGTLPTTVANMQRLAEIAFQSNSVSGSIPTEIGLMTNLQDFKTSGNNMTGPIPSELGLLTTLKKLFINSNKYTGQIPTEIGLMSQCTSLVFHTNDLTGTLPAEIFNLDLNMLQLMWLEGVTGTLPTEIGHSITMSRLRITRTSLSGPLPSELGQLSLIRIVKIQHNKFSGELPAELGQLELLSEFSVFSNEFTGTIPESLASLNFLTEASFALNNFTGAMPLCEDYNNTSLEVLVGDCDEVACPCCSVCCIDSETCDAPEVGGRSSESYLLTGAQPGPGGGSGPPTGGFRPAGPPP